MADTMQFDLVAPERRLASGKATAVRLPGADGDMTAMPDHAPTITSLRPGLLSVDMDDGGTQDFAVTGGFAEITADGTTVLAEEALPKDEVSADFLNARIKKAQEDRDRSEGTAVDRVSKLIADLVALGDQIGISTDARAPAP